MKINQWTLGLAAVGVVSLASAVNAEEGKMNSLQTALSSTPISGYVNTSINWNSIDNCLSPAIPFSTGKDDGFNLNVVKLSLEKAMDESEWASGYKVDLLFGPDAIGWNPAASGGGGGFVARNESFAIQQAYIALRTPVGNGIDWKMGVFNSPIGYESFDAGNNPNFTRSYGYSIEPTQLTGLLGTYRVSDTLAVAGGVANTLSTGINTRNNELGNNRSTDAWRKAVMGTIAVTAPADKGFLSGSTLYAGIVSGINNANPQGENQNNYYVGATLNTPVTGLKAGVAYDYATSFQSVPGNDVWTLAGYLCFQATEKLSLHGRAEIGTYDNVTGFAPGRKMDIFALTGTVQYDLWANVVSRLEVRYDHANYTSAPALTGDPDHSTGIYANFIYKF